MVGVIRLIVATAVIACIASATQIGIVPNDEEGRGKKTEKMMKEMYTVFMVGKNMLQIVLMLVSSIIQIKGFGLSVINTLLNIGRFILQLQANKQLKLHPSDTHIRYVIPTYTQDTHAHNHNEQWSSANQYAYYAPPPQKDWSSAKESHLQPPPEIHESLPPARASYVSNDYEEKVYPYYSPNITRVPYINKMQKRKDEEDYLANLSNFTAMFLWNE